MCGTNTQKTHWKKVVSDPNYIGEADFQEGEEKVLTIAYVNASETVVTGEGKSKKAVVHWKEQEYKPMILNVARSKAIEKVSGSAYFEDWPGTQVQLYIEHGIKAFGDVVSAVRVRSFKPRVKNQTPVPNCADCGGEIKPAMGKDAKWLAAYTLANYGAALCADCAKRRKERAVENEEAAAEEEQRKNEYTAEDIEQTTLEGGADA